MSEIWQSLPKWMRWLIASLATMFVASLSNGLWDLAVKPMVFWIAAKSVWVTSLAYSTAQDSVYVAMARDTIQLLTLRGAVLVHLTFFGATLGFVLIKIVLRASENGNKKVRERVRMATGWSKWPITDTFMLVLILVSIASLSREIYSSTTLVSFRQLEAIVAPYQTEQERLMIRSKFARMKTRAEFLSIVEQLRATAEANGLDTKPIPAI